MEDSGDFNGAIAAYSIAISLNHKNANAYWARGILKIIVNEEIDSGCLDLSKAGELGLDIYSDIVLYCN